MKVHKLALLISVLVLPTQELLAGNARDLTQGNSSKAAVVMSGNADSKTKAVVPTRQGNVAAPTKQGNVKNGRTTAPPPTTTQKPTLPTRVSKPVVSGTVGGFITPQSSATVSSDIGNAKTSDNSTVGPKLERFTEGDTHQHGANGDQSNSEHSLFDEVKGEAQVHESVEVQPVYKELSQFNVTSDSVVATATVVVDEDHRSLTLVWGDGTFEYVTLSGFRSTITDKNRTSDPAKFKFQHIYKAPFDQSNRTVKVLAKDANGKGVSASSTEVNINPRYTFILYPVQLEINEHLDSITETHSELYVYMNMMHNNQLIVGKEWRESIQTAPGAGEGMLYPVHYSLGNDSRVQLEMSYQDEPIQVYFNMKEEDNWAKSAWDVVTNIPASFDGSNQITHIPGLHPKDFTGSKEVRAIHRIDDDGTVTAVLSVELNLIVPSTNSDGENARFNNAVAR
ncbi:MAG: hypothetical protein COA63_009020 [Methylophaga sp.]|nr:hypothetical protein [Methylophaga sp.]